jgi:hypothetical protein
VSCKQFAALKLHRPQGTWRRRHSGSKAPDWPIVGRLSPFINAFSGVSDFYVQQHTAAPVPILLMILLSATPPHVRRMRAVKGSAFSPKSSLVPGRPPRIAATTHVSMRSAVALAPGAKKRPTPGGAEGWGGHARLMSELEEAFPSVWQQGLDLEWRPFAHGRVATVDPDQSWSGTAHRSTPVEPLIA